MNVINKNIIKEIKNELINNKIQCYVYDLNEIKQRINNVTKNIIIPIKTGIPTTPPKTIHKVLFEDLLSETITLLTFVPHSEQYK